MINTVSYGIAGRVPVARREERAAAQPSIVRGGALGAALAAISFGTISPALLAAAGATTGLADAAVYAASGVIFGVISGGSIGAVIAGRGR